MALPFQRPAICPVVVGRSLYLAALGAQLEAACAGQGQTIVLAGEAGIGKSRLASEVRARANALEMVTLEGRCFEPDRTLPYAPLLDLIRTLLSAQPDDGIALEFASIVPDLARLLPEIAQFLPDLTSGPTLDPEQEQRRLVHALVQLITRFAAPRAVLVIVEDLHWSDDASLEVLLTLARRLAGQPIVLLLTYRSDEVNPNLRHLLARLDRERLASELQLPRLAPAEVDLMLRAIFDQPQPIRGDFLQAIYDLTDGNPFFIEEVIRSLVASGDIYRVGGRWARRALAQLRIPRSVHDAVMQRIGPLSPSALRILQVAAVAGRRFDFEVLQAVTGDDEDRLLEAVRELAAAQLVVEESSDRFAFRHALTRQAIYSTMLSRERRALHLSVAEAIEHLYATMLDRCLADLSYHFAAGEAWAKAMDYGERAGRQALALYAPHAAVEHVARSLDAAARLGVPPAPRLLRERGRALALLGDFDGALADYQAVLERVPGSGDRLAEWRALFDLGGLWAGYSYSRAGDYFAQALEVARAIDRPEVLAESLAQLGNWYLNTERPDDAERCLQDALAIFERMDDRPGIARTIDLLGTVSDIAGDIVEMRRRCEQASTLFRELGDRQGLSSVLATMLISSGAYVFETVVVPPAISPDQATREAEESLALARAIGWRAGEAYTLGNLSLHFGSRGEYGRALEYAATALAIAREIDHREWMTACHWGHGMILTDLLVLSRAHEHLLRAYALAGESGSLHWLNLTTGNLAESWVAQGDFDAADAVLAAVGSDLPMQTLGQRRVWTARSKLALERHDPAEALAIIDRLFATASQLSGPHDIPLLALLRGQALTALERFQEAEEPLSATLRVTSDRGLYPFVWRVQAALGELYARSGRRAEARAQFQSAWEIVHRLSETLSDDGLQTAFVAGARAIVPLEHVRSTRIPRRDREVLTARERDVAALVARGLSNRAIADALSIGERTVETHVGNILGKLEFGSRAQIAAWAIESGLAIARG